jgi:CDGSH-type Zn-finger protein
MPVQRVDITEDGPYVVRGEVPIVRTAQVETAYGEPVGWEPDEPVAVKRAAYLCRCGGSSNKPFCDDTHTTNGFDGTEVADRGAFQDRAYPYRGEGLTMHDDRSLCERAGYCGDRSTNVWAMIADASDPEVRERIRTMSNLCPSGRLVTQIDGGEPDEPDFEPSVGVIRDGPLWIRGRVRVVAADGTEYEVRNRVTLCRCGASRNKPFCDGSHNDIGFRDG